MMHTHHQQDTARRTPSRRPQPAPATTASELLELQRKAGNAAVAAMIAQHSVHRALATDGAPLPVPVREEMQDRLGADVSDVRVHTDAAADESARAVNAVAFTSGSHIVFQRGRFDPVSSAGRHLLAHELTHVMQQRSGPVSGTDHGNGLLVSDPSDAHERAAESNADRVMRTAVPHVQRARTTTRPAAPGTIQRWAFVNGTQIEPDADGLTPEMKRFAADQLVRDYETNAEFQAHAQGRTDHLGNLPGPASPGTWVRFSPAGINVIGEQHSRVTLPAYSGRWGRRASSTSRSSRKTSARNRTPKRPTARNWARSPAGPA